jgi:hypothetical protein
MPESPPPRQTAPAEASHLGESLVPALREVCGKHLGVVEFFRSPFQHGGAATGFSVWTNDDGSKVPVMVKMPVGSIEHRWSSGLGTFPDGQFACNEAVHCPVPRVLKAGTTLAGYDFAWLVVERLTSPGVISRPEERHVHEILETLVEFQSRAAAHAPLEPARKSPDWERIIERSREAARDGIVEDSQKWNEAIHRVQKLLPLLRVKWESRSVNSWCHGDLHLGNLLHRPLPDGSGLCSVLVDLALVHPGHWIEDAIYLERQYWGHSDLLKGVKPVSELARLRRERGLNANDNYPDLANVRRVLMAACVPAAAEREGNAKYVRAALELLDRLIPQVGK